MEETARLDSFLHHQMSGLFIFKDLSQVLTIPLHSLKASLNVNRSPNKVSLTYNKISFSNVVLFIFPPYINLLLRTQSVEVDQTKPTNCKLITKLKLTRNFLLFAKLFHELRFSV